MKILVAGLGIIGGSVCMALKRAGLSADGWNRSKEALGFALENKIIGAVAKDFKTYDVVFVALPPEPCARFLDESSFKDGAVVADLCGVKKFLEDKVYSKRRNFRYMGCHPMAGKEVSGIQNACENLFDGASMVITRCKNTDPDAVETIKNLTRAMGFARVVECSAEIHDRKIAYTSQLAHIISNAYVKDDEINGCIGFTGGSFQDMTRIAGVDPSVWTSLYLRNSRNVCEKIESLVASLIDIKAAVESGDKDKLNKLLSDGGKIFDKRLEERAGDGITVYEL